MATGAVKHRGFVWLVLFLVATALFLWIPGSVAQERPAFRPQQVSPSVYRSPGDRHKIEVHDPLLAQALVEQGARLISDRGAVRLLEVTSRQHDQLIASRTDVDSRDDYNRILLNSGAIDTTNLRPEAEEAGGERLYLIQFAGPILQEWRSALDSSGVRVVSYIPYNTYLVLGTTNALLQASEGPGVQWASPYTSQLKVAAGMNAASAVGRRRGAAAATEPALVAIQLVEQPQLNNLTVTMINAARNPSSYFSQDSALGYVNIVAALDAAALEGVAQQPDVVSIQPYTLPGKQDEVQSLIVAGQISGTGPAAANYLSYLASKGFTQAQFDASGFVLDITDSGLDNGTTAPGHPSLYRNGDPMQGSRVVYSRLEGTPNSGSTIQGCDGHGALNTHVAGGYVPDSLLDFPHRDANNFRYGMGVAPFVRLANSVVFDPDNWTSPDFEDMLSRNYHDGVRIVNNSWGEGALGPAGLYNSDAQRYDALVRDAQPASAAFPTAGNQEMVIVFAAGNSGPDTASIRPPATAKNVLAVGASENVRAFGGADRSGTSDGDANNLTDIAFFSSRGPTADFRAKPDLLAPGTHVTGGVPQNALANPAFSGTGAANPCFLTNNDGVSGGVNSAFFPSSGQQYYTASSGTSHAAPAVAGGAALVRQRFINAGQTPPSPAMTKAVLMNSARYLAGILPESRPGNAQGMGLMDLDSFFDMFSTPTVFKDQVPGDIFTSSFQQQVVTGFVSDASKPFRVTLAWSDAPGSTSGDAFVNNLDLEVTVGGYTYKGNVFVGANSAVGGARDTRNNVESVILPAGVSGSFAVKITATTIAGDGVPNSGTGLDQDYALVIYNGTEVVAPVLTATAADIVGESCVVNNGAADPGESVSLALSLQNVGTAATGNLVATLEASGTVLSPGGPQNYGAMGMGTTVARTFTFNVAGAVLCGSQLNAKIDLQDGGTSLGSIILNNKTGTLEPVYSEGFDADMFNFPSGWTVSAAAGDLGDSWRVSTDVPDAGPNMARVQETSSVSDYRLDSPIWMAPSGPSTFQFRHRFETQAGHDGAVLEISVAGGAFTDIISAGGSFVTGAYTVVLAGTSPIAGRPAWSGYIPGYLTTEVNLPPSAWGQPVRFRFRMTSDDDNPRGDYGWRVDTVSLNAGRCCVPSASPDLTISKTHTGNFSRGMLAVIYDITVTNSGAAPTTGQVAVTESLPPSLTATSVGGPGWICTQPAGPCTRSDRLNGGAAYPPIELTADVSGSAPTSIDNTVSVSGGGETNTSNNTATDTASVAGELQTTVYSENFDEVTSPNLPAGFTASTAAGSCSWRTIPGGYDAGAGVDQAFVYGSASVSDCRLDTPSISLPDAPARLIFHNSINTADGDDGGVLEISIAGGAFTDILAAGGSFLGGGYNSTLDNGSGNPLGGRAAWSGNTSGYFTTSVNLPAAAMNQAVKFRFRFGTNNANAAQGWHVDSIVVTAAAAAPDLIITKTHTGNFSPGQSGATYTISVSNSGPGTTSGTVTVTESLPTGLTATAISGSGWNCTQPAGPCTRSDSLGSGGSYPAITLTVDVAGNAPASVTNTVTVSGGGEFATSNDTATDPTAIGPAPQLQMTSTHLGAFYRGQVGATYSLSVFNSGPGTAHGVITVSETPPAGLTITSMGGAPWVCTAPAGPCTWTGDMQANFGIAPVVVTVNVAANAPTSVTNQATVSGAGSAPYTVSDVTTVLTSPCTYSFTPQSAAVSAAPHSGEVTVTTQSGCPRVPVSDAAWLTPGSGPWGTGSGPVSYGVAANASFTSRTGHLTVGGESFTVTQAGALHAEPAAAFRATDGSMRLTVYPSASLYNSGGVFASDVAALQTSAGLVVMTARDGFNGIWANSFDVSTKTWAGWMFGGGAVQGVPAIGVSPHSNRIVARDAYNAYWHQTFVPNTGFGSWFNLGGVFATDPAVGVCPDGSMYLVGKDQYNALWSKWFDSFGGQAQFKLGGGVVQGKPSVSCGSDGAAYIAVRDNWNSVWMARVNGSTWTGWFNAGGVTSIDPQTAALGGSVGVVILDDNGAVWRNTFQEGSENGWQGWVSVGGVLQDISPSAVNGELYFTGRAPNEDLWWWRQSGSQWTWIGNTGVAAGNLAGSPR